MLFTSLTFSILAAKSIVVCTSFAFRISRSSMISSVVVVAALGSLILIDSARGVPIVVTKILFSSE